MRESQIICFDPYMDDFPMTCFINLSFLLYNSWHFASEAFLSCSLFRSRISKFCSGFSIQLTCDIAWTMVCWADSVEGGIILLSISFSFSYISFSFSCHFFSNSADLDLRVFSLSTTRGISIFHCCSFSVNFSSLALQYFSSQLYIM